MEKENQESSRFKQFTSKHIIALLLLLISGTIIAMCSQLLEEKVFWHHLLRDMGIALVPLSIVGLIYEISLREEFINQMKKKVNENVNSAINEAMPNSLKHLRNSGVVDAYERLGRNELHLHLKACEPRTEIRILDIWLENLNYFKNDLMDAIINKECRVTILLWDLEKKEVLQRRADSLGQAFDLRTLMVNIHQNLQTIASMLDKLEKLGNPELKDLLQVKIYSSFIGISLFGIGPDFYLGFYLREKLSSDGTQLKISGYDRFFYHQITGHFRDQWNDKTNKVFNKEDLKYYTGILDDFIIGRDLQERGTY